MTTSVVFGVGAGDGTLEGLGVGVCVGEALGGVVGKDVGAVVGEAVGPALGAVVGKGDGTCETDGAGDGAIVSVSTASTVMSVRLLVPAFAVIDASSVPSLTA